MGVNSLRKTVTRQRRDCDLNPGPSAPESSTLTTRLSSYPKGGCAKKLLPAADVDRVLAKPQALFPSSLYRELFLPASHSSTEEQAAVHIASSATRRRLWQLLLLLLMLRNRWKYCPDAE